MFLKKAYFELIHSSEIDRRAKRNFRLNLVNVLVISKRAKYLILHLGLRSVIARRDFR